MKPTIKKFLIFLITELTLFSAQAQEPLIDNQSGETIFCNITNRVITYSDQPGYSKQLV